MHRVGADPEDAAAAGRGHRRRPRTCSWGRCGPTWPWPTGTAPTTGPSPASSSTGSTRSWPTLAAAGHPATDDPRGQLGRHHRGALVPPRPGPLRPRRLRPDPDPDPGLGPGRGHRRAPAPARAVPAQPGDLRAGPAPPGNAPPTAAGGPCPANSTVATVPIGYADGVPRRLFDQGGEVLIGGVRRPLAGVVTMDQIVVDCGPPGSVPVAVGDEVVLIGEQGTEAITCGGVGRAARHHQLRGAVRHRTPGPPPPARPASPA